MAERKWWIATGACYLKNRGKDIAWHLVVETPADDQPLGIRIVPTDPAKVPEGSVFAACVSVTKEGKPVDTGLLRISMVKGSKLILDGEVVIFDKSVTVQEGKGYVIVEVDSPLEQAGTIRITLSKWPMKGFCVVNEATKSGGGNGPGPHGL